jgi:hypothetical protein
LGILAQLAVFNAEDMDACFFQSHVNRLKQLLALQLGQSKKAYEAA